MQQLDIFNMLGTNVSKFSIFNLDCNGNQAKLNKKNKAIKRGFEVGKIVLLDDEEYEIGNFCFNGDGELLCLLHGRSCHIGWSFSSSRLRLKK